MEKTVKRFLTKSRFVRFLRKAFYFGFKRKCNFCFSSVRSFQPSRFDSPIFKEKEVVGGGRRADDICPVCNSRDRERLLHLFLLRKTALFEKPMKLLHVAPEARLRKVLSLQKNLDYLTADISIKSGIMMRMDVTDIQFPAGSFDAILCNHVLEHVPDDHKAMMELFRVLRPGGWAVLQVPISLSLKETYEDPSKTTKEERKAAFGQSNHVRIYAEDYRAKLERVGFMVTLFDWQDEIERFGGRENIFGLNTRERVYVARKPG